MSPIRKNPFPQQKSPALRRLLRLAAEILEVLDAEDYEPDERRAVAVELSWLGVQIAEREQLIRQQLLEDIAWDSWTFVGDDDDQAQVEPDDDGESGLLVGVGPDGDATVAEIHSPAPTRRPSRLG